MYCFDKNYQIACKRQIDAPFCDLLYIVAVFSEQPGTTERELFLLRTSFVSHLD
jgi:hypothetical protein